MIELLKNRKKELELQLGYLNNLKYSKLLYLLNSEINNLLCFYTKKQVNQMINEIFSLSISAPYFYAYCTKNIKKDEKSKILKSDKIEEVVFQKRDTKKEQKTSTSILDEDELNVIAMYSNPKKD